MPLRAALSKSTDLRARPRIRFCHPGYDEPFNILITLPRVDVAEDDNQFGVHHRTALLACQIIANNEFERGRLAFDKDGNFVDTALDGFLLEEVYYFLVGDSPSQYSVVPSFQDWRFPHGQSLTPWHTVGQNNLSSSCAVTSWSSCVESAHIVPGEEAAWFDRNSMRICGTNDLSTVNSEQANRVRLRPDIRAFFDNRWFAVVPKLDDAGAFNYATHVLETVASELWPEYHNVIVQGLRSDCSPFLFARFAWSVLLHVKAFVIAGPPRKVVRASLVDQGPVRWTIEHVAGAELKAWYGWSKSATLKRKRSVTATDAESDMSSDDSSSTEEDLFGSTPWADLERRDRLIREYMASEETAPGVKGRIGSRFSGNSLPEDNV